MYSFITICFLINQLIDYYFKYCIRKSTLWTRFHKFLNRIQYCRFDSTFHY